MASENKLCIGQKVYIRTNAACPKIQKEGSIYKIEIVR
jgi:hypothetical protein